MTNFWLGMLWVIGAIECLIAIVLFASRPTQEWKRQEKISALSLVLNLLLFVGAVAGALIAYGAYEQTRRQAVAAENQLDVARTDQRPWIDISKISVAEDIGFDVNGARISLSFELANVGKSPAFAVTPWIAPALRMQGVVVASNGRYEPPIASRLMPGEGIIFPGRPVPRVASAYISSQQVAQAIKTGQKVFPIFIEVCAAYRFAFSIDGHKTCHTLMLVGSVGRLLILPDPLGPIGKDAVKLVYRDGESIAY